MLASSFVRNRHHQGAKTYISIGSVVTMDYGIAQLFICKGLMLRAALIQSRVSIIVVSTDFEFVHKRKDVAFICFTIPM